jgi:hypothetical protein
MEKSAKERNVILDLLRGYFLIGIFVNHLNLRPSVYEYFNGWGELWVSAAEGFVFISGILIGIIYSRQIIKVGFKEVCKRIWQRAFKLYLITTSLTILYSVIGLYAGSWPDTNKGLLYDKVSDIVVNATLLKYSYGWADILYMYTIFVAVTPLIIWMIKKGFWKILLLVSLMIWYQNLRDYPNLRESASYLPLESWQLLYVIAILVGFFKEKVSAVFRKIFSYKYSFHALSFLFGITIYLSVLDRYKQFFPEQYQHNINMFFDKLHLGPGRIFAFFVWFTFLYVLFAKIYPYALKYAGWILLKFGRNSLLNYTLQSGILFAFYYIPLGGSYFYNTLITTTAVIVLWLVTSVAIEIKNKPLVTVRQ